MPTHMILEVLSKADDYGRIFFQADGAGAISHTHTCLFVKPRKHEPLGAFLRRLQSYIEPHDAIELALDQGAVTVARITRAVSGSAIATG